MQTEIITLRRDLEALRRGRDQAATQIQTAINALDAGLLTLADVEMRIQGISTVLKQLERDQ